MLRCSCGAGRISLSETAKLGSRRGFSPASPRNLAKSEEECVQEMTAFLVTNSRGDHCLFLDIDRIGLSIATAWERHQSRHNRRTRQTYCVCRYGTICASTTLRKPPEMWHVLCHTLPRKECLSHWNAVFTHGASLLLILFRLFALLFIVDDRRRTASSVCVAAAMCKPSLLRCVAHSLSSLVELRIQT